MVPIASARRAGAATAWAAMAVLASCANLKPPTDQDVYEKAMSGVVVPQAWSAEADANTFRPEWIGFAEDAQVGQLIEEALAHNPDMRAASARLEQARYQMKLAGADLLPSVSFGAKYSNSLQPADGLDINGLGVVLNWEIDIWGRARAEKLAGVAGYRSAEADYVYARQSVAAMTVRSWLLCMEATRLATLADQMSKRAHRQAGLVADRERVGRASRQDVVVAQAQAQALDDAGYQAEQGRQQALRALELIVGRYPSASITVSDTLPQALQPIPAGVPADLVARRPDVVAARERYEAAFFNHEEARAARLPRLAFNVGAGHLSSDYVQFKNGLDSTVFPIGAKLLWPLFDAGRLKTTVLIRDQQQQEAAADYAKTILVAFGEVENALAADGILQHRETAVSGEVESLRIAVTAANTQYRVGKSDQYGVLQQEMALDSAQIDLVRIEAERRLQRVNLHLALGGEFENTPARDNVAVSP
jgi:multidrug efflux system outer membrane protein